MSYISNKNIFRNSKFINNGKEIEFFEENLKLFNKNSLIGKVYPSLLSKSISFKNGNYWTKKFNLFKLINFQINPFRILRLFISYSQILLIYIFNLKKKKKIICILTRAQGIREKKSLEDYRFKGLEGKLKDKFNIVYFLHGQKKLSVTNNFPVIHSSDLYGLSKLIFILIFPFLKFYYVFKKKSLLIWHYDLIINLISSSIFSFYSRLINISFFWDFNYYHYPIFLGSYLANTKLVGSMHNFNYYEALPWISDLPVKHLKINYEFNDYQSIFNYLKIFNKYKIKRIKKLKIKSSKLNIVIIQENQTNQESLIKFIASIKNKINKIYIKVRPDKQNSYLLLNLLKSYDLKFNYINNLFTKKTDDFIFFGTSSSLLLDLASKNRIAISYSNDNRKFFDFPCRNYVEFSKLKKIYNFNNKRFIENPIYISNKKNFIELMQQRNFIVPSNSTINHLIFNEYKIDSIMHLILS